MRPVDHLRDEGVTVTQASDDRLTALIDDASSFFESRALSFRMDGRCVPSIESPAPPIRIDRLAVEDAEPSLNPNELVVVGTPNQPGFGGPRLTQRHGRVFPKGQGNVEGEGLHPEDDGITEGLVPLAIRRTCILARFRRPPGLSAA